MEENEAHGLLQDVTEARSCMKKGLHMEATTLFLRVLSTVPDLLPELEQELGVAISNYTSTLIQNGRTKEALWLYDNATKSLPQASSLWFDQGRCCFQLRQYLRSIASFQKAWQMNPMAFSALDASENVKSMAVDRWHFRMLNDQVRNETYQRALNQAITEAIKTLGRPPVVLDIGTGTGLLSLMALKAGAAHVIACETNSVLAHIASSIATQHGVHEKIKIINKASTDLSIGSAPHDDLSCPVDIVVTELVDSGLLGEHILLVLRHARSSLLRPGGCIIPHKAKLYAVVIESEDIRRRSRLSTTAASVLGLPYSGIRQRRVVAVDERYTCESLATLPHRHLTREVQVMEIDLALPSSSTQDEAFRSIIDLEVLGNGGQADAVAVWFDLSLLEGEAADSRYTFSTSPTRVGNGWDQGLYFLDQQHSSQPLLIGPGQPTRLEVTIVNDQLCFKLISSSSTSPSVQPVMAPSCPALGEADVAQMNDIGRLEVYQAAIRRRIGQGHRHVVEWSGDYSVLGLLARGIPGVEQLAILTGNAQSAEALQFWSRLASTAAARTAPSSSSPASSSGVLPSIHILRFKPGSEAAVGPSLIQLQHDTSSQSPSLLIHDLIEGSGLIRQGALQEIMLAKSLLLHASPHKTPCLIPSAFAVQVQCMESFELLRQNQVLSDHIADFSLDALNMLGVRKFRELDLINNEKDYRFLSAVHEVLMIDLMKMQVRNHNEEEVAKACVKVPITTAGRLGAVAFWFHLFMNDEEEKEKEGGGGRIAFNTGPSQQARGGGGTSGNLSSYRQGAILLEGSGRDANIGDMIDLEVICTLSRGIEIICK